MESGKSYIDGQIRKLDLIDAMMDAADPTVSDETISAIERAACPTCVPARVCSPLTP